MKRNFVLCSLATLLVLAVFPGLGFGQRTGFQVGVAQPQPGFMPTQAPSIAVRGTFAAVPFAPAFPLAPGQANPLVPLVPNFPTVIIPGPVVLPVQTVFGTPFVNTPFVNTPVVPVVPPQTRPFLPGRGTPRADVLRQFGQPSVTVITSAGETLYFTGGVTIILQNGQVIGAR